MKLSQNFTLTGAAPHEGGLGGIWMNLRPQESVDAEDTGSGPSVADRDGNVVPGTYLPGMITQLNSNGNLDKATQNNLTAGFPRLYLLCFNGTDDRSGAYSGVIGCVTGVRAEVEVFDAGTYIKGQPVVPSSVNAGYFAPKALFDDGIQPVGFVGPKGVVDTILDIVFPQGSGI
jgi:hypothetical protein